MTGVVAPAHPWYRRIGLGIVLLGAAVPYRVYADLPLVASISLLDVALIGAVLIMMARSANRPSYGGDQVLLALLCVPGAIAILSVLWTQDLAETMRRILTYAEGIAAYLFAVQQTRGVSPERIITWLRRFAYLLLVPPVLMVLRVPGFAPQEPGLNPRSGDYLSYFTRLSHPFIGRSNNLATVLAMLAIILFYWGVTRRDRLTTRAAVIVVVAIALTISRGVIVALVISALFYVARYGRRAIPGLRDYRVIAPIAVIGLILIAAALAFLQFSPGADDFVASRLGASNVLLRESRLGDGLLKLAERPFLGFGAGTLPDQDLRIAGGVHNTYVQQLLAYGVVLGLVVIVSLLEVARRLLRRGQSTLSHMVGLTVLAQLLIYTTEASFEGAVLLVVVYLLLGMLVGLAAAQEVVDRDRQAAASDPAAHEVRAHG